MNKTISYKESTAIAIQAMMSAARKDEYADRKRKSNFPQNRKKRDVTLKDIREWNKRRNYKEDTGITINAMMESVSCWIFRWTRIRPPSFSSSKLKSI